VDKGRTIDDSDQFDGQIDRNMERALSESTQVTQKDRPDIRQIVSEVIAAALHVPSVEPSSSIQNMMEWDSLSHLQILEALESHFDCTMDLMEIAEVESVKDWVKLVEKYTKRCERNTDE
jgi:acyl carrier protein